MKYALAVFLMLSSFATIVNAEENEMVHKRVNLDKGRYLVINNYKLSARTESGQIGQLPLAIQGKATAVCEDTDLIITGGCRSENHPLTTSTVITKYYNSGWECTVQAPASDDPNYINDFIEVRALCEGPGR